MPEEKPFGGNEVGFNAGCLGLLLVVALSIGAAVALDYGARWLLELYN